MSRCAEASEPAVKAEVTSGRVGAAGCVKIRAKGETSTGRRK